MSSNVEILNMTPPHNIIRVDHEASHTHAWRVTLQRHNDIVATTFSDSIHGGKRKAFNAAVKYRDELLRRYSPYAHAIWVRTRLRKNNTSGISGVARYEERAHPNRSYTRVFWLASWVNEQGDSRKRRCMISHYGERQAKRLGVAERERQLSFVCASKNASLSCPPGGQYDPLHIIWRENS